MALQDRMYIACLVVQRKVAAHAVTWRRTWSIWSRQEPQYREQPFFLRASRQTKKQTDPRDSMGPATEIRTGYVETGHPGSLLVKFGK